MYVDDGAGIVGLGNRGVADSETRGQCRLQHARGNSLVQPLERFVLGK